MRNKTISHPAGRTFLVALLACVAYALAACNTNKKPETANLAPLTTVASVDVARYLGQWYQQAWIPNKFQAMCVADTTANYSLDGDGLIVTNKCRTGDGQFETAQGVAKIVEGSNNAKLRVSFFRPFYGNYWIIALDPDYQWVLVGEPSREYGWVLSRSAAMSEATLNQILDRAVSQGYDRAAFKRSLHTPAQ